MTEGGMLPFTPNVSLPTSPPKVAVIGSGYIGARTSGVIITRWGVLKLIYDKNETVCGQFQVQYPQVDTCLALNEVLNRDDTQD